MAREIRMLASAVVACLAVLATAATAHAQQGWKPNDDSPSVAMTASRWALPSYQPLAPRVPVTPWLSYDSLDTKHTRSIRRRLSRPATAPVPAPTPVTDAPAAVISPTPTLSTAMPDWWVAQQVQERSLPVAVTGTRAQTPITPQIVTRIDPYPRGPTYTLHLHHHYRN